MDKLDPNVLTVILTIAATIVGGVVTWLVSWRYYVRSSKELEKSAEELRGEARDLNAWVRILLATMEDKGWVKLNRDEAGRVIGRVVEFTSGGTLTITVGGSGTLLTAASEHDGGGAS